MDDKDDNTLIQQYLSGDSKAFELLANRYKNGIFRFILGFCNNHSDAEDLLQEVFIKVIKGLRNFKGDAKFSTYLFTIARNCCIDRHRKKSRIPEKDLDHEIVENFRHPEPDSPSDTIERSEIREIILKAVNKLPPEQKEAFLLKEESGATIAEIAQIVDCPENTIKSRLRYAVRSLRLSLENRLKGYLS